MPTPLPVSFTAGALPPNESYTPQELFDAIAARLQLVTQLNYAMFTSGGSAPSSDTGPWLKDGTTWWVWNVGLGQYVPATIDPSSIGYIIAQGSPDPSAAIYRVWYKLDGANVPQTIYVSVGGSWVDAINGLYYTKTQTDAIAAATLASANTYTNTAVGGAALASYPAVATLSAPQTIAIDTTPYKADLTSAPVNPAPSPFNTTNRRYIAPATGIYMVSCTSQFDNATGAAATMEVHLDLFVNGSSSSPPIGDLDSTPSPNGSRWSPGFAALISLNANDYLEIFATMDDTVNTGNITLSSVVFSVFRVSA